MPLRDHFHAPLSDLRSWDSLHGQWPAMIVIDLNQRLPAAYSASPHIHLGTGFEVDVATFDEDQSPLTTGNPSSEMGSETWSAPRPTLVLEIDEPHQDEYEVRVIESQHRRLVAAIEIISPANKDRLDHRRAFAAKCAALVSQGVCVSIVDLVTNRPANLYGDLLNQLGEADPAITQNPPTLYAVTCRGRRDSTGAYKFESWFESLAVNSALPTLPLWLSPQLAVPLDLEKTYQDTCRILRIL